jgi:ribosomal protein L44E
MFITKRSKIVPAHQHARLQRRTRPTYMTAGALGQRLQDRHDQRRRSGGTLLCCQCLTAHISQFLWRYKSLQADQLQRLPHQQR